MHKQFVTLPLIIDFIRKHRNGVNAFVGWDIKTIAYEIVEGLKNKSFVLLKNEEGEIDGFILAKPYPLSNELHIIQILSRPECNQNVFRAFYQVYKKHFDGFNLTATRRGKFVKYNTQQFFRIANERRTENAN